MCIGVPGKIIAVGQDSWQPAVVEVAGIQREVNITLVCEGDPAELVGLWALVHVGFAMSLLADDEADEMLSALAGLEGVALTH